MDWLNFFEPFPEVTFAPNSLGANWTQASNSTDLKEFQVAIMAVPENRWVNSEEVPAECPSSLIERIGSLYIHEGKIECLVIGQLKLGATVEDTEAAVKDVVEQCLMNRVCPIIIGGDRRLMQAVYGAYEHLEQVVNLTTVDPWLHLGDAERSGMIGELVMRQPNFLFNYSNIGFQTYLNSPQELELAEKLFFDSHRLGKIRGSVHLSEPIIRGSEVVALSMDAVKHAEFSASTSPQPNGFYAEEVCQMMRYAGLSEKCEVMLLSDIDHDKLRLADELLIAEMVWCFIDGFSIRKTEVPSSTSESFLKYRIPLRDDEFQLVFYKSLNTDRWWMEVPVPPQQASKYRKHCLVPCDYEDYQVATEDDLPERWWKTYKKML